MWGRGVSGVFGTAILVSGLVLSSSAHAEACRLLRYASFDILGSGASVVQIPVTVNGSEEHFLLDTAGVTSTISSNVVDALHLTLRRLSQYTEVYAADGSVMNHYVSVDKLGIGGASVSDVKLLVLPEHSQAGTDALQGTLGPDLLRNFDLDFDFAAGKLNLISPDHCKGQVVYWASAYATLPFSMKFGNEHIEIPVTLDGHEFTAVVDTGASRTLLLADAARNYFGLEPGGPGTELVPGTSDKSLLRYRHRFTALSLNGVLVKNPMIGILPNEEEKSFWRRHDSKSERDPIYGLEFNPKPIILGMDVLSKLHLYIAYGEKTLYVTAADAGPPTQASTPVAN